MAKLTKKPTARGAATRTIAKTASKKASAKQATKKAAKKAAKKAIKKTVKKTVKRAATKRAIKKPARSATKKVAQATAIAKKTTAKKTTAKKTATKKTATKKTAAKKTVAKSLVKKTTKASAPHLRASKSKALQTTSAKAGKAAAASTRKAASAKAQATKSSVKTPAKKSAPEKAPAFEASSPKTLAAKSAAKPLAIKPSAIKPSAAKPSAAKPSSAASSALDAVQAKKPAAKPLARRQAAASAQNAQAPASSAPAKNAVTIETRKLVAKRDAKPGRAAKASAVDAASAERASANPLLTLWPRGPLDLPPFEAIGAEHYAEAFREAMARHKAEMEAIAADPEAPTFANTIEAIEKSGALLNQVGAVFWNLVGSNADDALQALEREFAPQFAAHYAAIALEPRLFARIETLWENRDALGLTPEQARVLERHRVELVRSGAKLGDKEKTRVAEITERLASLTSAFMQNVMKDEQSWRLTLEEDDLDGLPDAVRDAARRAAQDAGLEGRWAITLARSSVEGFLTFSSRRDLREQAFRAWISRGSNGGETDNTAILAEVVALRGEYARLMGFDDYAGYNLDDAMAKTPAIVDDLLSRVWTPAVARAGQERAALADLARAYGAEHEIEAWDWRYYAEKLRKARYDFDQAALRPYLSLDAMIEAAFYTAGRLFGLSFEELKEAPRYHPDVRVWAVKGRSGEPVGLFLGDYFARPGKRSGAWMSGFRSQSRLDGDVRPIIVNVMNFARAGEGQPSLLSFDDARTLFHEFGHALHGLLSNVTYPSIAGTAVARDFVELPSQLYEHWLSTPEILERFARHAQTRHPMPAALIERMKASKTFDQGHATVEYVSSALVDMALYSLPDARGLDVLSFEKETLDRLGMPPATVMRHRLPHFQHIVGGYAAGYYSYMWSEVMDADAFAAFEETGDVFDPQTAERLETFIYSAGNSRDPAVAWEKFRGRAPSVEGLLKSRGLD